MNLATALGDDKAAQLMPTYTTDGPLILPDGITTANTETPVRTATAGLPSDPIPGASQSSILNSQFDELLAINRFLEDSLGLGGNHIGSNNWVIGGTRTTTGKPLLANDPHLGASIPSIWYLAHISGGAFDAIGATLPGIPGIVIGHNQRIAWGVTNTGPDVQDLFLERINDRNEVEYKGAWEPMQIVQEVIKVKDRPDVTLQVRITRHGPLISDVDASAEPAAFRWPSLDNEDHTIEAFLGVNRAGTWDEFTGALASYHSPMQNFVYADVDGNIGYYAPGALPIRAKGDGKAPVPGWSGEYDWSGYVPFDQLPHAYNPPQGYIATANNKVAPDSYPHIISNSWAAPYRATRIIELIEAKPQLSPDDIAAMQADVTSAQARQLLPYLLQAKSDDSNAKAAIDFLQGWDGTMRGDSPQAAVYEAWYQQIPKHIFADEVGDDLWENYGRENDMMSMIIPGLVAGSTNSWCDDVRTPQPEDCRTILGGALVAGLADMSAYQGTDKFTAWRWDKVHHAQFPHNPFDNVGPLRPIFSRSIPNGGDDFTVNVAPIQFNSQYFQRHVPSYRQIVDLSDLDASRFNHTVGQSGYVLSGDYSNLLERWQRVEYLPMRFTQAAIDGAAAGRLTLEPAEGP
jgi:penicillin G amidase